MARFVNDETKVVVSVADEKADRFTSGWTALGGDELEPSWSAARADESGVPKGNASRQEWADYADSLGVEYDEDAKREDIKAAIEAASSGDDE